VIDRLAKTPKGRSFCGSALAAATLTGCALLELARDCEGTDDRVKEVAALDILDSRPDGAAVAQGFEEVDADCEAGR
jgi:hypothetical protein